jgi:hypothetical protein
MGRWRRKGLQTEWAPHSPISDKRGDHFTRPGLIECVRPRAAIPQSRSKICTLDSRRPAPFRWSAAVTRGRCGDRNKLNLRPAECHTNSTGLASGDSMKCRNDQNHSFLPVLSRAHDRRNGMQIPRGTSVPINIWLGFERNDKVKSRRRVVASSGIVTISFTFERFRKTVFIRSDSILSVESD